MKLRCQYNPGAGRQLQVLLPKGFKLDNTDLGLDEEMWLTIWHERWVQFPTKEWEVMQNKVMQKIIEKLESIT